MNPSEEDLMGRPLDRKEFPFEEPKKSEAHTETRDSTELTISIHEL